MTFVIKNISGANPWDIAQTIHDTLLQSRFTANVDHSDKWVKVSYVRLKQSKDYCGNHPLPCPVRPGGHRPHRHMNYLEGADWVAFNDMLNDILDKAKVSANAASSLVVIRKGKQRCVRYTPQVLSNGIDNEWVKDSFCFENRIGKKSGRSEYPPGTPGIPEYKL